MIDSLYFCILLLSVSVFLHRLKTYADYYMAILSEIEKAILLQNQGHFRKKICILVISFELRNTT